MYVGRYDYIGRRELSLYLITSYILPFIWMIIKHNWQSSATVSSTVLPIECDYLLILCIVRFVIMVFMKTGLLFVQCSIRMSWVYGYDSESKSFCNFPYNGNPTRTLNTAVKCCLPSTDATDRREKFTHAYQGSRSPHASALH